MKKIFTTILVLLFSLSLLASNIYTSKPDRFSTNKETSTSKPEKNKNKKKILKSLMDKMTIEEMVGQLIMIDSYAKDDSTYYKSVIRQLDSNKVGGVCFFKGTTAELLKLNKIYDSHANIPLFVAIDGEWGLNMRMTDVKSYPVSMTLGALPKKSYSLVYDMAENIAQQCLSLGININFAPDVDININPNNPVINMRSFGQDKYKVSLLAEQYVKGLQDNGVMAVIKHFPGHGDTETDSHKATPLITHTKGDIDTIDTYPFRYNIKKGVWAVMVGHLQVDALSQDTLVPASINKDIINDYLLDDCEFEGLVFTDAMNMKGLTTRFGQGEAEVKALEAGVDIILMPENTDKAIKAILSAIESGRISEKLIKEKCKKILSWKYDMGLFKNRGKFSPISNQLFDKEEKINTEIAENVITLIGNQSNVVPMRNPNDSVTLITVGNANFDTLIAEMKKHCQLSIVKINSNMKRMERDVLIRNISSNHQLITAIGGARFSNAKSKYGIPDCSVSLLEQIESIRKDSNIVLLFANPYVFKLIDSAYTCQAFLVGYENNAYTQKAMAKALFGEIGCKGFLPVTVKRTHVEDEEEEDQEYRYYMDNNIDLAMVQQIDSIANSGITEKAYPGCQVLVAKDGKILINKSYGYYTYDNDKEVTSNTIYDIASLTKVMATTLAVMKLYDEGKIKLDEKVSTYIPELKKCNAGKLTIKELLSHYSTLPATYPFYRMQTKETNKKKAVIEQLKKINTDKKKRYLYSDLNFLVLQLAVENITSKNLDEYLEEKFYAPMELSHTTFNPLMNGVNQENIAPTELDTIIRHQQIVGEVHDPMAYYLDGVCGNAGLFSTTEDLFKICQMILNNGTYNNKKYLDSTTIATFNHRYYENLGVRRALGFDKPFIHGESSHCSKYASQKSIGHSGFTGTYLWIEPENKTIFIFLSNRVYPSANHNKLSKLNIRTDMNNVIYRY